MNKNEFKNFIKQYKHTVCFDEDLKPLKVLEAVEQDNTLYCYTLLSDGKKGLLSITDKIIPLKGRLKEKDYNYIESLFNKLCQT